MNSLFYMLQIFAIVSLPIFLLAGTVLLSMIAFTVLKNQLRTRIAMRRIAARPSSAHAPQIPCL